MPSSSRSSAPANRSTSTSRNTVPAVIAAFALSDRIATLSPGAAACPANPLMPRVCAIHKKARRSGLLAGAGGALALVPGLAGKDLLPLRLELVQARLVGRLLLRFLDLCQLLVVLRAALG